MINIFRALHFRIKQAVPGTACLIFYNATPIAAAFQGVQWIFRRGYNF